MQVNVNANECCWAVSSKVLDKFSCFGQFFDMIFGPSRSASGEILGNSVEEDILCWVTLVLPVRLCAFVLSCGWRLGSFVVIESYFRDLLLLTKPFVSVL